jgi:AcrR family transcriptional regulator
VAARGDATREKLIEATVRLVGEVGYARATTRAIAQAAGVAEGTLYRHYPDKAGLFAEAVRRQSAPVTEWVRELPGRAGTGTVTGNLVECLTRLATLREAVVPFELAMLTDPELALPPEPPVMPPGPPEFLAEYLRAEQRIGRIRADADPGKVAIVLLAALFGLSATPRRAAAEAAGVAWPGIDDAVRLVVDGLAPR